MMTYRIVCFGLITGLVLAARPSSGGSTETGKFHPKVKIELHPREGRPPVAVMKLIVEQEFVLAPEHIPEFLAQDDKLATYFNPFTKKKMVLETKEIEALLLDALALATNGTTQIPGGTKLVVIDKNLENAISMHELVALDSRLSSIESMRLEGVPPDLAIVLTEGLTKHEMSFRSSKQAAELIGRCEQRLKDLSDPSSPRFDPTMKQLERDLTMRRLRDLKTALGEGEKAQKDYEAYCEIMDKIEKAKKEKEVREAADRARRESQRNEHHGEYGGHRVGPNLGIK